MKLCIDCKYCVNVAMRTENAWYLCSRPDNKTISFVTGEVISSGSDCEYERTLGNCGRDAKFFEPKNG